MYHCYYPHMLRDSVSPVCGIFGKPACYGTKKRSTHYTLHIIHQTAHIKNNILHTTQPKLNSIRNMKVRGVEHCHLITHNTSHIKHHKT